LRQQLSSGQLTSAQSESQSWLAGCDHGQNAAGAAFLQLATWAPLDSAVWPDFNSFVKRISGQDPVKPCDFILNVIRSILIPLIGF